MKDHPMKNNPIASFPALTEERHRIYEERAAANRQSSFGVDYAPERICNASAGGAYLGEDLKTPPVRPGAADHERVPSLHMGWLRYRDGAVVHQSEQQVPA